jgi:hypothetical protein
LMMRRSIDFVLRDYVDMHQDEDNEFVPGQRENAVLTFLFARARVCVCSPLFI